MASGNGKPSAKDQLDAYKKEIGKQYMDGLISEREYEALMAQKASELEEAFPKEAAGDKEPECPSCGALVSAQDTECMICGSSLTPILPLADAKAGENPKQITTPDDFPNNWREDWLDKPFRKMSVAELLTQPPDALKGVSESDSRRLREAFNIKTIADFASVKYLGWAFDLARLKEHPERYNPGDFKDKLTKNYEGKPLEQVLKSPTSALQGVSDSDAANLAKAFNTRTIEELGNLKFIAWARGIFEFAERGPKPAQAVPSDWRDQWLTKDFRDMPVKELLAQPPHVLKGVSQGDSEKMRQALNIKTLEGFATNKHLIWSQELASLEPHPEDFQAHMFKHKLIKKYETKQLGEILDAPVYALQGVSESDARLFEKAFNTKTVRQLGTLKFLIWAGHIYRMAPPRVFRVGEGVLMPDGRIGKVVSVTDTDGDGLQNVEVEVSQ